jgi:hypothetical protein
MMQTLLVLYLLATAGVIAWDIIHGLVCSAMDCTAPARWLV